MQITCSQLHQVFWVVVVGTLSTRPIGKQLPSSKCMYTSTQSARLPFPHGACVGRGSPWHVYTCSSPCYSATYSRVSITPCAGVTAWTPPWFRPFVAFALSSPSAGSTQAVVGSLDLGRLTRAGLFSFWGFVCISTAYIVGMYSMSASPHSPQEVGGAAPPRTGTVA